ncbi:pyridoxamine 5'-phosphate oxidase family protein [Patescibacteria group bacterium]|nr:pyridoxamine 5'-phosphate oxidase family protein [Patescibacteria group bacterium]MCL5114245.1 pyridoxamine 5'-phosphate oxidase family protein [Patescibacteria group bacterium]
MTAETKKAKEIIAKIIYITVATVSKDGEPWNSPVYSAFDSDYNFYWVSPTATQHSKNIKENGKAFLVIYDSTAPEGTGDGVYIKAKASEVRSLKELAHAFKLLYARKDKKARDISYVLKKSPLRVYKAVPEKAWLNTFEKVGEHSVDGRIEVKL